MFHGLESLRVLRVTGTNRLRKVEEGAFAGTPNLEALYLVSNKPTYFLVSLNRLASVRQKVPLTLLVSV